MQFHKIKEKVLIIDFGSQVTKLIARRVRDLGIFSEIITPKEIKRVKDFNSIRGIILSGGPSTVTKEKFERVPIEIFSKKASFPVKWQLPIFERLLNLWSINN